MPMPREIPLNAVKGMSNSGLKENEYAGWDKENSLRKTTTQMNKRNLLFMQRSV